VGTPHPENPRLILDVWQHALVEMKREYHLLSGALPQVMFHYTGIFLLTYPFFGV
jgi:hypothetical protein